MIVKTLKNIFNINSESPRFPVQPPLCTSLSTDKQNKLVQRFQYTSQTPNLEKQLFKLLAQTLH